MVNKDAFTAPVKTETGIFDKNLKQRKRGHLWRNLGIAALVGVAGVAGYATLTQHGRDTMGLLNDFAPAIIARDPDLIFDRANSDHVNILLIGRDVDYKIIFKDGKPMAHVYDETAKARSDTMIVISLDRRRNTIRMVSLPRDAQIHMPPNKDGVGVTKLNAAHSFGGPPMLMRTLHDELGLTIHHYAVIRFEGFKKLIDMVGGVEVDVIGALKRDGSRGRLKYDDNWGNLHIDLQPGRQRLDGAQAHNYVRFRMDLEGDPGRIRRQQQVMRALAKEIMNAGALEIPGLIKEVRNQFETNLTDEELASAAFFAKNIGDPSKIQPISLFGIYGTGSRRGSLILNKPKNEKLLAYIFGPTFNPDRFLVDSPWTRRDELGEADLSNNPAAKAVLREAGLIKANGEPVRITQSSSERRESVAAPRDTSRTSTRRRSELAVGDDDTDRSYERREETSRYRESETRTDTYTDDTTTHPSDDPFDPSLATTESGSSLDYPAPDLSSDSDESQSESPVPVPDTSTQAHETDDSSNDSSPIPEAG